MKLVHVFATATLALLLTACGWRKQHLTDDYAKSYDAAFAAQRSRPTGPVVGAVTGLDSQEAAIISDAYRSGLIPKGVKSKEEPLILVAPTPRDRPQTLAPSVPKEK